MFLQPHCLLWALVGRFHRVVLMTTVEVVEQSSAGGLAVLAPCTLQCSVPPSTHHPPPPSQQTQLSSPLNQSWCLFNYWEQRGSLTNSFSQPLIAPSLAFLSSSLCHSLCLDFSLRLPPSFPLIYLALSSLPAPFVLQCIFIFMDSNHSSSLFPSQSSSTYSPVTVTVFGLFLIGARPPSIYLVE